MSIKPVLRELFNRVQKAAIENASLIAQVNSFDSEDVKRAWLEGYDQALDDVLLWIHEESNK